MAQKVDAQDTILEINNSGTPDWLIVDHYGIDSEWERMLRPHVNKIMIIDDIADRKHDCDILLDQNFGSSKKRYDGLVSSLCIQLHGPSYALLDPIFKKHRDGSFLKKKNFKRILIYFGGGAIASDITAKVLEALHCPKLSEMHLDVVVSESYPNLELLRSIISSRGNTTLHYQLPNLADLMSKCDLAIGAGGSTSWERCFWGLPSIVISTADNQRPAVEALAENCMIQYLGHVGEVTPKTIRKQILELLCQPKRLEELSAKGMKLVDGKGADRVVKAFKQYAL